MTSETGVEIRERMPKHSPIHEEGNPLRELIEEGIGANFDDIENQMFTNSNERFLQFATGANLDKFGKWFDIPRKGKTDDEYRAEIIALRSCNPTIAGIRGGVAAILGIDQSKVTVSDNANAAEFSFVIGDLRGGAVNTVADYNNPTRGVINISVPAGSDITTLQGIIQHLVLATMQVNITTY